MISLRLDLPWTARRCCSPQPVPVAYATVLNYVIAELLMRPVIKDIA